jgi:GT2 family glycosyltransferase
MHDDGRILPPRAALDASVSSADGSSITRTNGVSTPYLVTRAAGRGSAAPEAASPVATDDRPLELEKLRRQNEWLQARVSRLGHALVEAERRHASVLRELTGLRYQHQALLNSTMWRALYPLRLLANRLPPSARQAIRAALQIGWRSVVRRSSQDGTATPVDVAGNEVRGDALNNDGYATWIEAYDTIADSDREAIVEAIDRMQSPPLISVLMPVYETPERYLREAIESVQNQLYPHWELCIADDASPSAHIREILEEYRAADRRIKLCCRDRNGHISAATNSALALAIGEYIALLDQDDVLPEHALYVVAAAIAEDPQLDLLFSDEDKIDTSGRRYDPCFKPDWSPDLMLGQNMFSHFGVYRRRLVEEIGGCRLGYEGAQDHDLVLRASARTTPERIKHLPYILYHWRAIPGSAAADIDGKDYAADNARKAVTDHLDRQGIAATVVPAPIPAYHRVHYPLPWPRPLVSLIVPTRDRVKLLQVCIDGLLRETDYPDLEVIIVDNDSVEPETHAYFRELASEKRVRILPIAGAFNYSALNNRAAELARGDVLGLINNDIEVIQPGWLYEMVGRLMQPGVGAVGAKLYYADDTVQHGGVVLGIGGVAGHDHRYTRRDAIGKFGRLYVAREVSAITAACMLVRKDLFVKVGGLDESGLKVAFNDVDLCLKLRETGARIIWTPYAELYHHESASRGMDLAADKIERFNGESDIMRQRWGEALRQDPFYNPNLTLEREDFSLAFPPRVAKPWHPVDS